MILISMLSFICRVRQVEEEPEKENKKDPAKVAEAEAAKQRETIPLEQRTDMFRAMLAEKEVNYIYIYEGLETNSNLVEHSSGVCVFYVGKRAAQNCIRFALLIVDFPRTKSGL